MIHYHGYEIFKDNLGRWCYYFTKSPYSRDSDHKIAHASTLEEVKKLVDDELFKNYVSMEGVDSQATTFLTAEEKAQFEKWADENDESDGYYGIKKWNPKVAERVMDDYIDAYLDAHY
jgi:hypothetical protein